MTWATNTLVLGDDREFGVVTPDEGPDYRALAATDRLIRCGVDLVDIDRIAEMALRFGSRFLNRVWTMQELALCRGRYPELSARFAGKEATMKALGTGTTGVSWREIEILKDSVGKPVLLLHGGAARRAGELELVSWSVSLTHSRLMACAVVVAAGRGAMLPTLHGDIG